ASPSDGIGGIIINKRQRTTTFLGRDSLQIRQGQRSDASAEWAPVPFFNLKRRSTPFVTHRAAPLQSCSIIAIAFGKASAAARFCHLLHLFERQPPYTCTIWTPSSFSNARWNSAPLVPRLAFPEKRDRR